MRDPLLHTWRHCEADIILWAVWWYLRDVLNARDVEEHPRERTVWVDHTMVSRGVERQALALEKRCRPSLGVIRDAARVDETDSQLKKPWYDLHCVEFETVL